MSELIEINGLTKSYGAQTPAVNQISITIPRGRIVGLLGTNGSGKTTLIKMLNGLLVPNAGSILIDGLPVGVQTKAKVAYLPDRSYLSENMTIRAILSMFADFYSDFSIEKAKALLTRLGIDEKCRYRTLSKGNKEKLQLILVMSRRADLYILDEPIAGVDPAARDFILKTILENHDTNSTILLSTHLIRDVEDILDEVIFMHAGKLVLYTSRDYILQKHGKSVDGYFKEVFSCSAN